MCWRGRSGWVEGRRRWREGDLWACSIKMRKRQIARRLEVSSAQVEEKVRCSRDCRVETNA